MKIVVDPVTVILGNHIINSVVIGKVLLTKMSTITFNVGGKEFTISKAHVYKSARLTNLLTFESLDVHFLDYNYDAFAVVLDFLRHDRILVPATVNGKTVEMILDDLEVKLSSEDREALSTNHGSTSFSSETEFPPQYSPTLNEKYLLADKTGSIGYIQPSRPTRHHCSPKNCRLDNQYYSSSHRHPSSSRCISYYIRSSSQ